MNDLISRKDLLDKLNKIQWEIAGVYNVGTIPECDLLDMVIYVIENAPTAFDVDKVLEELKSRRSNNLRCSKMQINPVSKKIAYYNRAVEDEAVINIIENEINKRKEEKKNNGKSKIN